MAYPISSRIIFPLLRWRIASAEGLDRIPRTGSCLLVSNHVGLQDPQALLAAVITTTHRKVHVITKWPIFATKFSRRWLGTIPLHADRSKTVAETEALLRAGELVCVYPEAGINSQPTIGKVKTGAARLALTTRVPVIPLGVRRTSPAPQSEADHRRDMFFGRVRLNVGQLIDLRQWYGREVDRPLLNAVMAAIMKPVAQLANKTYVG
jgi:1-acyl-sn-glycerol-3-phosphate acyltransferase